MRYKILKELKIGKYTVKPGSTIEIVRDKKPLKMHESKFDDLMDTIKNGVIDNDVEDKIYKLVTDDNLVASKSVNLAREYINIIYDEKSKGSSKGPRVQASYDTKKCAIIFAVSLWGEEYFEYYPKPHRLMKQYFKKYFDDIYKYIPLGALDYGFLTEEQNKIVLVYQLTTPEELKFDFMDRSNYGDKILGKKMEKLIKQIKQEMPEKITDYGWDIIYYNEKKDYPDRDNNIDNMIKKVDSVYSYTPIRRIINKEYSNIRNNIFFKNKPRNTNTIYLDTVTSLRKSYQEPNNPFIEIENILKDKLLLSGDELIQLDDMLAGKVELENGNPLAPEAFDKKSFDVIYKYLTNPRNLSIAEIDVFSKFGNVAHKQHVFQIIVTDKNFDKDTKWPGAFYNSSKVVITAQHPNHRKYPTVMWARSIMDKKNKSILIIELQTDIIKGMYYKSYDSVEDEEVGQYDDWIEREKQKGTYRPSDFQYNTPLANKLQSGISHTTMHMIQSHVRKNYPDYEVLVVAKNEENLISSYENVVKRLNFKKVNVADTVWADSGVHSRWLYAWSPLTEQKVTKYKVKKEIMIEGNIVKPGSIITIHGNKLNEAAEGVTWGEVKQIYQIIFDAVKTKSTTNLMGRLGKLAVKIGSSLTGYDLLVDTVEAIDGAVDVFSAAKATTNLAKLLAKKTIKNPNDPNVKNLMGPFWDAIKLSPGISKLIDDDVELQFFAEVIEPLLKKEGNDNDVVPNMDSLFSQWANTKVLKSSRPKITLPR